MIGTDSTPKKLTSVSPVSEPESPAYMILTVKPLTPQFPGAGTNDCFAAAARGRPTTKQGAQKVQRTSHVQKRDPGLSQAYGSRIWKDPPLPPLAPWA
jgi:hypothetical protein